MSENKNQISNHWMSFAEEMYYKKFTDSITNDEKGLILMSEELEEMHLKYDESERQVISLTENVKQLEKTNAILDTELKKYIIKFLRVSHNRQELEKQNKNLTNELNSLKEFILKESTNNKIQVNRLQDMLSSYFTNILNISDDEIESNDILICDKSDDDFDDEQNDGVIESKHINYQLYRKTTLGQTLQESLDELLKAEDLKTYEFWDNVWTFVLKDVEFMGVQELVKADKVKIIAFKGKSPQTKDNKD